MFYYLSSLFVQDFTFLNIFKYLTFRSGGALLTSLIFSFLFAPSIISWLKKNQSRKKTVREDLPNKHLIKKRGTPTMGGILILISFVLSTLLWTDTSNYFIWLVLSVTFGFGAIGFIDDYFKLTSKDKKGLKAGTKLIFQFLITSIMLFFLYNLFEYQFINTLAFPFFKNYLFDLGVLFPIFAFLVIIGTSNGVNLTDGLDGLAIVPVIITATCLALIAYLAGHKIFSEYLNLFYISGAGELAVLSSSLVGACLGFLWFNAHPAKIFMGDTGSLSIGAALGSISIIIKHEIVLFIIGFLFVIETMSVILQVSSFKLFGKRLFLMSPLHHHFEKKGWHENTIVIRFWILSIIFALIGLATLKVR
tara:strand:- start:3085 stop:4173 length:1089 start_codon:yes stop_codon:yes gene_type:complete